MKKTKLSIIVPVYNSLLYLPRCIESMVVAQNVQDRIEIILIDDGSNDGTEKLVDMFASRYSNIKVIHENNSGGPAHPRNVGLSIANGEYVFFCDNDDYFAPHALEKMIKHADEWKPDVMAVKIGDDGSREIIARSMFKENNSDVDIYRSTISKTLGPWKLYKRSFLQKNNFEFPIDCPDDNPFVLKAYLLANRVSVAADQDYYYWTEKTDKSNLSNQDNSTWFNFEKKYLCTEKCFKIYEEYADKKLGQIYMLPRLLEWPTWTFQGIILLNDKETPKLKEYITNLRKMLLSVCDEEFLKKKAKLEEYVTLKTLIDYKDFDVAKRILMDYQKSKWKTLECGKEGTFYSLANKKFIIDADYFIKPVVDVLDVEYMQNNLYLNCEITTSNFTPKEIHNSKIILKKYKSDIQYEYADFVLEANEDGKYTLNTKIDLSTFICYLNKNNDNSKSVRWDIALQIGKNYTKRLNITNETTLFTKFSNYLYVEKEKVLVPHVSDGEVMCFWYIVEKSNDFSKEFFKYKKNRSLVNLLSVNLISQSDFDIITKLHKEYKKGKINLKIISNEEIKYCGKKYKVGYPAFIESCIYDRRGYHALKKEVTGGSSMKKHNGIISFWKFMFCLMIVVYHANIFAGSGDKVILSKGSIGVEFFFLVSGYLMAKSACNKKSKKNEIGKETFEFIFKKIRSFFPYILVCFIGGLIVKTIFADSHMGIYNYVSSIWDLFFLRMAGFKGTVVNGAAWYISAMLICMSIIYPLIRKYKENFFYLIAPLSVILIGGYMNQNYGSLRVPDAWLGLSYKGVIRAYFELCLGALLYPIVEKIKTIEFTNFGEFILTLIEVFGFVIMFFMSQFIDKATRYDYISLVVLAISIALAFSEKTVETKMFNNKFFYWLEKMSLPIYLSHTFIRTIVNDASIFMSYSYHQKIIIFLTITFAFSWLLQYVIEKLRSKKIYLDRVKKVFIKC